MKDLYTKQYFKDLLYIIEDEIKDLAKWSVWNNDQYNQEIIDLQSAFNKIKKLQQN